MARRKNTVEETGQMDPVAFIRAVKNITDEKGISEDIVFEAMELALATAYKKNFGSKTNVRVDINRDSGEIKVMSYYIVVDEIDSAKYYNQLASHYLDTTSDNLHTYYDAQNTRSLIYYQQKQYWL